MKGLAPLFIGIFGTFAFSWVGLTVIPNWQIGSLNPQSDEEGTDIYPRPQSGMFQRGAHVYAANGCVYCHSQQVRADYIADDIERKWGDRRSAPRDYIFQRPVFLGKMRMGQDLANIGARAPAPEESPSPAGAASPAAQERGLQLARRSLAKAGSPGAAPATSPSPGSSPATAPAAPHFAGKRGLAKCITAAGTANRRCFAITRTNGEHYSRRKQPCRAERADSRRAMANPDSRSAADVFCRVASCASCMRRAASILIQTCRRTVSSTEKRRIAGERSAEALQLSGSDAPPEGWEIVPTFDAKCVVAYLMGLNQSHPLKEVRSVGGAPATGGAPSPAVPGASPAPAAGGSPAAPK